MSYDPKESLDSLKEPLTQEQFDRMVKEYEAERSEPAWRDALPSGQRKGKRKNGGEGLKIGSYNSKRKK